LKNAAIAQPGNLLMGKYVDWAMKNGQSRRISGGLPVKRVHFYMPDADDI
jgi:hypothetical protein